MYVQYDGQDWTDTRWTWTVDATNTAEHFYALDTEIWKPELFIDNSYV
jgi:hypothetical protein